jgi:hypothetical protein
MKPSLCLERIIRTFTTSCMRESYPSKGPLSFVEVKLRSFFDGRMHMLFKLLIYSGVVRMECGTICHFTKKAYVSLGVLTLMLGNVLIQSS